MSTYGVIARRTATGYFGRLHQNNGHPHILGSALYRLRNGHFQGDTASMLRVLVDEHPAGWSDITNKDFALAPGFVAPRRYLSRDQYLTLPDAYQPQCYCHGERSEPPVTFTEEHTPMDATFLYVIDEVSHTMDIHLYRWPSFSLPMGEPERLLIGQVDLDGPVPSWRRYRSERIFYTKEEWDQLQRGTIEIDVVAGTLPDGWQRDPELWQRPAVQHIPSAPGEQPTYVTMGWLHYIGGQKQRCQECGDLAAYFLFDHFGYDGIERDFTSWEEELAAPETAQNLDTPVRLGTLMRQKMHAAQQQGIYRVSAAEPVCETCLADFIDAYLGEEDIGASAVDRLRSAGGLVSCVLAWEVHSEEAKHLDLPCAFYTNVQMIPRLRTQFPPA
jgi:hypothetical protein